MKDPRKEIGRIGEELAAEHLINKGWELISRNWSTKIGELDIIADNGSQLVFVEVRTTTSIHYGYGFQSINHQKQQQVRRVATQFIQQYQWDHLPIRFDVISVFLTKEKELIKIDHLEEVF